MTITTLNQLYDAMANNSSRVIIDKASVINTVVGQYHSLWRATGQPGQGAIPGAAASCDNTLTGAIQFNQQTAPATSYLSILEFVAGQNASTLEIHDRLAHMGGLNGTLTTAQTVNVDLDAIGSTDNVAVRKGDSNYSDVQWWLEWYTDTGATVVTATVNVTFNDGTSNNLTGISLAATRRASFMQPLNSLIQAADSGKYIRDVNTVQLSATTGAAGSFGVTATRYRGGIFAPISNGRFKEDWASLGTPEIPNESCLFGIMLPGATNTGAVRATGKISHG